MVVFQWVANYCLKLRLPVAACLTVLVIAGSLPSAAAEPMQTLHGHIPAAVGHLRAKGRLAATNQLSLTIGLPLRNQETLTNLLTQLYDPNSANYRNFLTPDEFAKQFGPTEQDYQAAKNFARANGLTIAHEHGNRTVLTVHGSAADIEKAFHVNLLTYAHPKENRDFFAPDSDPTLPASLNVLHIGGLDNYFTRRPMSLHKNPMPSPQIAKPLDYTGSGMDGSFIGGDFRSAYVPGSSLTGTGQSVALLEFDGYYAADITTYEHMAGLPAATLTNVLLEGFNGIPVDPGANTEVSLDIEMVISMAPNSRVIVYEEPNGSGPPNDILNQIALDNQAAQISSSWGFPIDLTTEQIFIQYSAQGQSYFNASGDDGAFTASDGGAFPPSDDPNVISVGGTTLTTSHAGGPWASEKAWNYYPGDNGGSSGGISTIYSIPSWQQGISMSASQGSTSMRNVPDVALTADNIFVEANNGTPMPGVAGTSAATPLWAGFMALVNQQAAAAGKPRIGFANPAFYSIGKSLQYSTLFHDITSGNNFSPDSPSLFNAVSGYDLCTGWGTPAGTNLINALAPVSNGPQISLTTATIAAESCLPTNGSIDAGETVTVSFGMKNVGSVASSNLVVTLQPTGGILGPSGPQTYGALAAGGSTVSRSFTFTAGGTCGSNVTATFQLDDGATNLGTVSVQLWLGKPFNGTNFVQNFDSSGSLPSGWTSTATGGESRWSITSVNSDTSPYCIYAPEPATAGISDLVSPAIPIGAPNAQLTFANGYDTYEFHTGGVLEIQLGTNAYQDILAAGGSFSSGGYNSTIPTTNISSALAGRQAWSGSAGVFQKTVVNLPAAAAGQTVHLRWRLASDNYYSYPGWYIDSVSMTESYYSCCSDIADLTLTGSASTNTITAGQNLTYSLTVSNSGPQSATGASLTNTLPAGATFVSASSGGSYGNGKVVWTINSLAANTTNKFSVTVTPTTGGTITNTATVGALTPDTNSANQSASIVTTVNMLPAITTQPSNVIVLAGSNATFAVAASGMPAPAYQWYFNSTNLPGAASTNLTVTNVQLANQGGYYAIATNVAGSVTSLVANLTVAVAPTVTLQPSNQIVLVGMPVNLQAAGTGTPSPTYQWYFNGTNLAGATNSSLTLASAQPAQSGSYSVLLTNIAGSKMSSNALVTITVPQPTLALGFNGSSVSIALSSLNGVTYTLLSKDTLAATNWTAIGSAQPGTGNAIILTDPNPGSNGRFYRVLCSW